MSFNSFFQFFVPKEKKFYPLYQKQAEYIDKAAKLLRQMLIETDLEHLEALKKRNQGLRDRWRRSAARLL